MSLIKVYISSSWKDNRDYNALNNIIESIKINLPVQSREVVFLSNPEQVKYDATKLPSSDIVIFHLNNNRFDANKSFLSTGLSREIEQALRGNKKTFLAYKRVDGKWCTYDMTIKSGLIKGIAGTTNSFKKEIDKLLKEKRMRKIYFKDSKKHSYVGGCAGGMQLLKGLELPDCLEHLMGSIKTFKVEPDHFRLSSNTAHYPKDLIDDIFLHGGQVIYSWVIHPNDCEYLDTPPSNCLEKYVSVPKTTSSEEDMFAHFDAMADKEEKSETKVWRFKTKEELVEGKCMSSISRFPAGWVTEMIPIMGKSIKSKENIEILENAIKKGIDPILKEEKGWRPDGDTVEHWYFTLHEITNKPLPESSIIEVSESLAKEDVLNMFDSMHEKTEAKVIKVIGTPTTLRFKTYKELEEDDYIMDYYVESEPGYPETWTDEMGNCFGNAITDEENKQAILKALSLGLEYVDVSLEEGWLHPFESDCIGEIVTIHTASFTTNPLVENTEISQSDKDLLKTFDKMSGVDKSDTVERTVARSFGSESSTSDEMYYYMLM